MKHLNLILIFLFIPIFTFGQSEYFATDSSISVGIRLIDNRDLINAKLCQVKENNNIIEYSPYDIKEFGFKDGRVYVSKEIQIKDTLKRVFLKRLQNGKVTLYFYKGEDIKKTFFIEKDSTLFVEVPKQDKDEKHYSEQLLNLTEDCQNVSDACKLVQYNTRSLFKLITMYNQCKLKPFPHFRYGGIIGYEYSKQITLSSSYLSNFDLTYDGSVTCGVFIDIPIHVSDFSLHAEGYFSKHGFSYNRLTENNDIDLVANISSLEIPIQIRYTYPSNIIRPYINGGVIGLFNAQSDIFYSNTTINGNTYLIGSRETLSLMDKFQLEYCYGGGIECQLNYKKSIFIEIRHYIPIQFKSSNILGLSGITLLTGISF